MEIEKVNVLGVGISVLDQDRAREFLFDAVQNGRRGYVTVTGVHGVVGQTNYSASKGGVIAMSRSLAR